MEAPIDYAIEKATPDVARTIRWLQSEGFRVIEVAGGPSDSFGNVSLTFEHAVLVMIVRDRGQWAMNVAPAVASEAHSLHVLMTAMTGAEPNPGRPGEPLPHLPDQLPDGVEWSTELPKVVRWLESGDRSDDIADADRRWRRATRERFKSFEPG